MQTSSQIESLLKRDRMVVVSGVVAVVAIAWA
jgi:predicted metal-binding membrane protein